LGDGIAGYFSGSNSFPKEVIPGSNEHETIFINLDTMGSLVGTEQYNSTIAHEFQHMVHSNMDFNEDSWINEGMSITSEMLYGNIEMGFVAKFLTEPDLQLNTWSTDIGHYGDGFLFC